MASMIQKVKIHTNWIFILFLKFFIFLAVLFPDAWENIRKKEKESDS